MINDRSIQTVTFVDPIRGPVFIKDLRPIQPTPTSYTVKIKAQDSLDFIAQTSDVFGPGSEDQAYQLFDQNAATIIDLTLGNIMSNVEVGPVIASLQYIKTLQVPIGGLS